MASVDQPSVEEDLRRTLDLWRRRLVEGDDPVPRCLAWLASGPGDEQIDQAVARAMRGVRPESPGADPVAPLVVVTKAPHGNGATATAAIAARCAAFGLLIRRIESIPAENAQTIAQTLYADAWVYYRAVPRSLGVWSAFDRMFANERFEQLFGIPFARSMVVPAADVMRDNGLQEHELACIWSEGRLPIGADLLARRYGALAAEALTGGAGSYEWYRGPWPIGIQRLAPSLLAFALRHERLYNGAPTVVLNGNFLLLSSLFGTAGGGPDDSCSILAANIPAGGATVAEVRQWLIGEHDDPAECRPGTVRHDAWAGTFPSASTSVVRPWSNVVHCSDGHLAGLIETRGLLHTDEHIGLGAELLASGYDPEELAYFLLSDPVIRSESGLKHLTRETKGLDLTATLTWVAGVFPPTFGPANGYGAGLSVSRFAAAEQALLADPGRAEIDAPSNRRPLTREPMTRRALDEHASAGRGLIVGGCVAMGVPAAGTGGRFGGYDLPEGHPRRTKALADVITMGGRTVSALDVRLADRAYWQALGANVPMAITAASTSLTAIRRWADDLSDSNVYVLDQPGVFRWSLETLREGPLVWGGHAGEDFLLREPGARPMAKPAGSLGIIAVPLLSGLLSRWAAAGVRYLALANSDDVGARLEPSVVGYLEAHPDVDAAVLCVPEPYAAELPDLGRVWCDRTGWSLTENGAGPALVRLEGNGMGRFSGVADAVPMQAPLGGWLCESELVPGSWSVTVAERARPPSGGWFSTNQLYLRISSLLECVADGSDTVTAVRRLRDRLPLYAEQKQVVDSAGTTRSAVQVFQPLNTILHALRCTVPISIARAPGQGQQTGYASLKTRDDVPLVNAFLAATTDPERGY